MNKPTIIVFCGRNMAAGQVVANSLRTGKNHVVMCAATPHLYDAQVHDRVLIMPDVDAASRQAIHDLFAVAEDFENPTPQKQEPVNQPQEPPPAVQEPPRNQARQRPNSHQRRGHRAA